MKLNFILSEESTDLATDWHTHTRAHKRGVNPTSTWYTLGNTNAGGIIHDDS